MKISTIQIPTRPTPTCRARLEHVPVLAITSIGWSQAKRGNMAKKKEPTSPIDQDLKKYVTALCKEIAECVKRDDFTLARRQSNDLLVELAELEAQKRVAE
jgi:hypothetical protein